MKERIQKRLENEFNAYKKKVLALDKHTIFNNAFETVVKQEISVFFIEMIKDNRILEFLDRFAMQKELLNYLFDLWLNADSGINNEIFDTLEIEIINGIRK